MTALDKTELFFDIQYGYWFNLKCERFYRHLDLFINTLQLVGGSGALVAVVSGIPWLLATVGVALAFASSVSLLVQPAIKAGRHEAAKNSFVKLLALHRKQDADSLESAIASIRAEAPAGLSFLEQPAYNAAVCAIGRDDARVDLTRFESIFE